MLIGLCISFTSETLAASKKVAVYVEGDLCKNEKAIVSSAFLARITGNKDFKPFERNESFINALTKESDYQLSGEVADKEIRSVGERLGVDYVVVVNVLMSSDEYCHMSARLINLKSGEILKTVNAKRAYTGSSVLLNMSNNIAFRLIDKKSK